VDTQESTRNKHREVDACFVSIVYLSLSIKNH
jgi:hypothetical protein